MVYNTKKDVCLEMNDHQLVSIAFLVTCCQISQGTFGILASRIAIFSQPIAFTE